MGFLDRLKEIFAGPQVDRGGDQAMAGEAPAAEPPATEGTDPAAQSASAAQQSPEEQRQPAAEDPASSFEPGTEGRDQEPS